METNTNKSYKIEISHRTIIFAVAFVLLLRFLWTVKSLLFSLFIAFIIMSALKPAVVYLNKRKIPRTLAAVLIYLLFLGLFINSLTFFIPTLVRESVQLLISLPIILDNVFPGSMTVLNLEAVTQNLPGITSQILNIAKNVFSNAVFVISTIFLGLYFLIEEALIKKLLIKFFDEEKALRVSNVFNQIEKRLSNWFWGQIMLMVIVGILSYIGLSLVGVKYSLALAVLAGVLEIVPNLGPVIAAVPAILIGFSQTTFLGFAALAVAFIVQQLENNFIVPLVMKRATGIHPIITVIALIVGGNVGGPVGVVLAIPITLSIETLLIEILKEKKL